MQYYANVPVLRPEYMSRFACVGSACEDTCCRGRADVDRKTYRAFKALANSPLKQRFFANVAVNGGSNPYSYASIQAEAGQPCPFLMGSGLCSMQAELGEAYLSCVCYTVPRRVNRIGGAFEISMRLVCPEACRVALLDDAAMEFESSVSDVSMKTHIITEMTGERAETIQPAWFGIRSAFIDILQDRRLGVGYRLFLAALTAGSVDEMNQRGAPADEIRAYLDNMARAYAPDDFASEVKRAQCRDDALFARLLDMGRFLANNINTKDDAYRAYAGRFLAGLNGSSAAESARLYRSAEEKAGAYLAGREHVFENWLVNELFSRCFPMRNRGSVLEEFTKLALFFFLMRSMLAVLAAERGEPDDGMLVDFIHRHNRPLELESQFDTALENFIAREKLADIQTIMAMTIYHP